MSQFKINPAVTKAQPSQGSVHVDRVLTNMSVSVLSEEGFIGDQVFPVIPVAKQSDLYRIYERGAFQRDAMKKRAAGTESSTIGYSMSTTPYFCDVWSLAVDIDEQTEENADEDVNLDLEATTLLSQAARINRDRQWATNYFTGSVWGATEALAGTDQWSDYTNSDPLAKVEEKRLNMMELTGFKPNTIVMGPRVWGILKNHPDLVDRLNRGQTGGPAKVLLQNLAELFEVERIIVPTAIYNAAVEGAANDFDFLFGKSLLMLYVAPSPGRYTASAGYTFTWRGFSGSSTAGTRVKRFEMPATSSRRVEIESSYNQKVIAPELGTFLSTVVA
jgi:hypothetical protein